MKLSKKTVVAVVMSLALFGCGSTESDIVAAAGADSTVPVLEDDTDVPGVGEETDASLMLIPECRGSGWTEAFGAEWNLWGTAPEEFRNLSSVDGIVRFESWDLSTFESDQGVTVEITYERLVDGDCEPWE